jgi:hypothetical protein
MSLFIKVATTGDTVLAEAVLAEDFDSAMDSFTSYAERKLRGYSVKEIDVLAKAAKTIDSEVKKRETLERINNALVDARAALVKAKDTDKKKELRTQIEVLTELKTKVAAFKVVEHPEEVEHTKAPKDVINLDER